MKTLEQIDYPSIIRTARGISIAGTRITLYNILDYLHAGWSSKLIQQWLDLTDAQVADVMNYIADNREELEREYDQVLRRAKENEQYWKARERDHLARRKSKSLTPEQIELRAKFQTWRSKTKRAGSRFS